MAIGLQGYHAPSLTSAPEVSIITVSRVCRKYGIPDTTFGRRAVGDPNLVRQIRAGRELKPETRMKVASFIASLGGC